MTAVLAAQSEGELRPLHDQVVICRRITEEKSLGGVLIPNTARDPEQIADVLAVGPEVREVKKGDRVIVADLMDLGRKVDMNGRRVAVVREADLLGVVEDA